MKKLAYRVQIQISMGIFLLCFAIAHVTKCGIFTNLGWMIAGLFFVINPVWPKRIINARQKAPGVRGLL